MNVENNVTEIKPKHTFYNSVIKRLLDIVISVIVLVAFSWLYAIIAILVRVKLGSPVIFVHERPGMIDPTTGKERIFRLYKFRSMTNETDDEGNLLPGELRMTGFGRKLRATSLDEIPEVWNILKGDMSLVGPRPWNKKALDYYTEREHKRHVVRPGLTGLAQVNGRNSADWETRFSYDYYYVNNVSFGLDLKIIGKTIVKVLNRAGLQEPGKHEETFWAYRERQWAEGEVPKRKN